MAMDHLEKKRRLPVEIPHLPKEIIPRIQHFLNAKEAAQTTVLSKSWCSAWPTRPDLDPDERDFPYYNRIQNFSEFANKTFKRYEDLNLHVQSFKLLMIHDGIMNRTSTNFLSLQNSFSKQSNWGLLISKLLFFPHRSFLSSYHMTCFYPKLSVSNFIVDLRRNHGEDRFATYPNLKSLILTRVRVRGDLIRDLNSRWPLIEELTLDLDRPIRLGEQVFVPAEFDVCEGCVMLISALGDYDFSKKFSRVLQFTVMMFVCARFNISTYSLN